MNVRRRLVVAAMVFTLVVPGSPAVAGTGIHLEQGPADDAGCYSLEVWNNDQLVDTIPADDGPTDLAYPSCASNVASASLPNGVLIFDWIGEGSYLGFPTTWTEIWASDGTAAGTWQVVAMGGLGCDSVAWQVVGKAAFIANSCPRYEDSEIVATRGAPSSTFTLAGETPGAGAMADGMDLPLYVVVGKRILYSAKASHHGRELWVSNGTVNGTHMLVDIRVGRLGSSIRSLTSNGRRAHFTANDGKSRTNWVSDGTRHGTHRQRL